MSESLTEIAFPLTAENVAAVIAKRDAEIERLRGLLIEAEQFISDGGCDEDDTDVVLHRAELLGRIAAIRALKEQK